MRDKLLDADSREIIPGRLIASSYYLPLRPRLDAKFYDDWKQEIAKELNFHLKVTFDSRNRPIITVGKKRVPSK